MRRPRISARATRKPTLIGLYQEEQYFESTSADVSIEREHGANHFRRSIQLEGFPFDG
jgi:hypothetical protein